MDIRPRQTTAGGGISRALNPLEDQDLPTALPNPQALTIAGPDGNDTYDGSVAKTISAGSLGAVGTNARYLTDADDILRLPCGTYVYEGIVPAGKNYPAEIVGGWGHVIISVIGLTGFITSGGDGYSFVLLYHTAGALYTGGRHWSGNVLWTKISGTQV